MTVAVVKIPDRETGGWEIEGEEIGRVSSKYGDPDQGRVTPRPRWGEQAVWRLDESGRYALWRASMSVIYHRSPTTCRRSGQQGAGSGPMMGSKALPRDLPDDAEACPVCWPPEPEDLADDDEIRYEFTDQSLEIHDEPQQVIRRLTRYRRHTGEVMSGASGPSRDLLEQCRANDPDFAEAEMPAQRVS
jgi:hypothetical protein